MEKLGLHAHAVHGIAADGGCTCNKGKNCRSIGKHPVLLAWQELPFDLAELDAMLASNWRFNLGLKCGLQPNGWHLVVFDVDGPRELLEPLEQKNGPLPRTLSARTGSGGLHLIYRVPPNRKIPNRVKLVPGVDVRAEGGQIVVSPSLHRSGNHYSWLDAIEPAELYK
jgi:putative DNA primase/helicase